ncbi:MAG: hypothetical protein GY714_32325 [Desulfobacterales bacterium]|nr:hypothetical protein [Desulfobacterales bacterium]
MGLKEAWSYFVALLGATIGSLSFVKGALVYLSLVLVLLNIRSRWCEHKIKMKELNKND